MPKYAHDKVLPYEGSGESKKEQVARMFDEISGKYDFLNRFLSAGIDVTWRKKMLKTLKPLQPKIMLDVATGTGDVAIMAEALLKPEKIIGIDISDGMLDLGRDKLKTRKLTDVITLQNGDSEAINFPDNSFDAVTVAFGVRNFENLEKGLQEILRVLKPGGMLCVLEFSKPTLPGIEQLYNLYLGILAPEIAKIVSKNKDAYKYLNNSVRAFPEGKAFTAIMNLSGYKETTCRKLSLGICSLYTGRKQA
ncbi:MAG: bifunctional demethylmenaquinone methyltransferase/2-methoxy-6-polyprenyl-1,4-benzoquinol methylase UbiE [Sphingobacteriales bacterium]|nr:MAG: bifunctional demethylmenaquinone methyltransferase/2-methoxy-6-polyprenyl-1,4-benzoquinol methylase UbiE [Sphingobacteriales bacterium]